MGFYDNEEQIYETSENVLGVNLRDLDEEELSILQGLISDLKEIKEENENE